MSDGCFSYLEMKSVGLKQRLNFTCGISEFMANKMPYQLPATLSRSQNMQTNEMRGLRHC